MSFLGVAKVLLNGTVKKLDGSAEANQQVTAKDVQDPMNLAKLLTDMLADVARLKRRHYPRRMDFEDLVCFANNDITMRHGFNGRVRWWVVEWASNGTPLVDSAGNTLTIKSPMLHKTTASDNNTLVLHSDVAGTATIRVEEAG